ncbi:MAG: hypothetical protein Fur0018_00290 [Anaerolineales bacterium]
MPRAGSGWHYNLIHDLVVANGGRAARDIRTRYHLEWALTAVNCNIGTLSPHRLLAVSMPSLLPGNHFVIKAHAGPTASARLLMRLCLLRVAYIYRDPRDALLSSLEHGKHSRQSGHHNAFAGLTDFHSGLTFMQTYVAISQAWLAQPGVLATRYEDFITAYDTEASRIARFLQADPQTPAIQQVITRYRPKQAAESEQKGLHFRKGKIGRFREAFTPAEQEICWQTFGAYLEHMGYPP